VVTAVDPAAGPIYDDLLVESVERYLALGWKMFVLRYSPTGVKEPAGNCNACNRAGPGHEMETCTCLLCHGFYAATNDPRRLADMFGELRDGQLALRTGSASGVVVIDAEGHTHDEKLPTGVEVIDTWEDWAGGFTLPATARALTPSGGVHLYYRTGADATVRQRGRVLPNVDIKGEGGYVALPPSRPHDRGGDERRWLNVAGGAPAAADLREPSPALWSWLRTVRGGRGSRAGAGGSGGSGGASGHTGGYDYDLFLRDGPPDGFQSEFLNDRLFRLIAHSGVDDPGALLDIVWPEVETWEQRAERRWDESHVRSKIDSMVRSIPAAEPLPTWRPAVAGSDGSVRGGAFTSGAAPQPDALAADPGTNDSGGTVIAVDFGGDGPSGGDGPDDVDGSWSDADWDPEERATDLGNGLRFTRIHGHRVRYVARDKAWLIWDGNVAAPNHDGLAFEMTRDVIADLYRFAEVRPADMGDEAFEAYRQRWGQWANKSESVDRRVAMLKSAETNRHVVLDVNDLDPDPHALNTPSGLLDLRTGEIRTTRFADLCTRITNVPYDPAVRDSAELDLFFETFMPDEDDQRFTFALLGRALHGGNLTRVFPIILGGTTSGKSQLLTLMHDILGTYASAVGPSVLRGNLDDKPRPDLIKAMHTRLAIATEASKKWVLHADQIKRLTGGDPLPYRGMYGKEIIETIPRFTPVLVTNELPSIPDADAALKRRIAVLAFDRSLPPERVDPAVKDRFQTCPRTRQAVLTRLVEGARDRWSESLSNMPTRYMLATLGALGDLDHVGQFIQWITDDGALTVVTDEVSLRQCIRLKDLYGWYRHWLRDYAGPDERGAEVSYKDFNRRLRDVGWESGDAGGARWKGRALTRDLGVLESSVSSV